MAKQHKNSTDTSRKGDFSPLKEGTKEFSEAVSARKELINSFGSAAPFKGTGSISSSAKKHANRKTAKREMGKTPDYTPASVRQARFQKKLTQVAEAALKGASLS